MTHVNSSSRGESDIIDQVSTNVTLCLSHACTVLCDLISRHLSLMIMTMMMTMMMLMKYTAAVSHTCLMPTCESVECFTCFCSCYSYKISFV